MADDRTSADRPGIMPADYSHLIGKLVRTVNFQPKDTIAGRLESCRPIPDSDCISAWIRRRSGHRVLVSGRFQLEPASQAARTALLVAGAVAAERERICQLADHVEAFYPDPDAPGLTLPFADLIGDPDA